MACVKPKARGDAEELWTTRLLARRVRERCEQTAHPSLAQLAPGTASKIAVSCRLRPHKIKDYMEKRDRAFEEKMAQVLVIDKLVPLAREREAVGVAPQAPLILMAGLDLLTRHIHRTVVERNSSREFVAFPRQLDAAYPAEVRSRLVLDHHAADASKKTRKYLATTANGFEFVFRPVHGSWLNLVESIFAKLTNSLLRDMWVETKEELKERI